MKRWMVAGVGLLLMLLSGCRTKQTVSDQVVVTGIGIDRREGRYVLSIQAVEALRTSGSLSEQKETATAVYTAEGASVAEALQAFLNETGKSTYILQNQIIVISMAQCREESLFTTLDYFVRNQEGRALVDLVVCHGDPSALLDIDTGNDAIPAEYVSQLLAEGRRWGRCVQARLLDAERAFGGMYDLAVPILEMRETAPALAGTALFRDGRLTGELTETQTTGLLIAANETAQCLYTIDGNAVQCEDIRTTITIVPRGAVWEYRLAIKATAKAVEGGKFSPAALEERLKGDVLHAMTAVVTEQNADPLGLARRTAAQYRSDGVTQHSVRNVLSQSRFTVTAEITARRRGFLQ